MNYVKKTHTGYTFDVELKQAFFNKWSPYISHGQLVKLRSEGIITDNEMKVIKFLFEFNFATADMLARYIGVKEDEKLYKILENLVQNRILNKFILAHAHDVTFPPDAMEFYCLDIGGKTLMTHFSNEDTTKWNTTYNMKSPENITSALIAANFYIRLMEDCPSKLLYFNHNPIFKLRGEAVYPAFEMGIKIDDFRNIYYVGVISRGYDYPVNYRTKINGINSILTTNAWKKYYHDTQVPPTVLILAEDDKNIVEVSTMTKHITEIGDVKYSSDERLTGKLNQAFLELEYKDDGKPYLVISDTSDLSD